MEFNLIYENRTYKVPFDYHVNIVSGYDGLVAVALERGPELISVIYSIYKQKIPYLPIDLSLPKERIRFMLKTASVKTIITRAKYITLFDDIEHLICMDNPSFAFHCKSRETNDQGYVIFTSGSSGYPKGVIVKRSSIENFIYGVSEIIDFTPGKRIASFTSVSFDIFFLESIMSLEKGLIVVLANDEECKNPAKMMDLLKKNEVEMLQLTPSKFQILMDYDRKLFSLTNTKEIMLGGEPLPQKMLEMIKEKTNARIFNMYGPTETTIWSTIGELTYSEFVHIGKPIHETEIYIIDDNLNTLRDGQAGEICIAGKGLAKEYIEQSELTSMKFITLCDLGTTVYRTGDYGYFLPDGNLQYIGRIDNQIKIRGYRIELEEIERIADQFDGIIKSIVVPSSLNDFDQVLILIYKSYIEINEDLIKEYLKSSLPLYMIPIQYIRCEDFVYNDNGKIDRKQLYYVINKSNNSYAVRKVVNSELAPRELNIFTAICECIQNLVVEVTQITVNSELESIGLTSLSFIRFVAALEQKLDIEFDDEMLENTKFPNIITLISYISGILESQS